MDTLQARMIVETLGIEQDTIASELNCHITTVNRWLKGKLPIPFAFEEWLLERLRLFTEALDDYAEDLEEGGVAPVPVWMDQETLLAEGVSVSLSESRAMSRAQFLAALLFGAEPEFLPQKKELM